MKRLLRFVRHYQLFSIAIVATVIALLLQLGGEPRYSHLLLAVVAIGEVLPLLWSMWQDLRSGRYGVDILAATAIIASVILGQYWAAIVVVIMLTGGEALEDYAHHRAQAELNALLKRAPQKAHVIRKGKTLEVTVNELKVGDKIIIKPGEVVPVDAAVLEGTANFDESSLTGESLPESKQIGDQLLSGSINIDGAITAKATATAEHSQYQQIIKLVRGAASSQAPFVRLADRYAVPFTAIAYVIALGVWAYSGEAIRFLEVIVVATPCPLLLAAPIALISGMARASRYGIISKTARRSRSWPGRAPWLLIKPARSPKASWLSSRSRLTVLLRKTRCWGWQPVWSKAPTTSLREPSQRQPSQKICALKKPGTFVRRLG
jgi:cation transport ATPase